MGAGALEFFAVTGGIGLWECWMAVSKDHNKKRRKTLVRRSAVPSSASAPVATPMFPSVVYSSPTASALDDQYEGRVAGYTYAREGHPNADVLAEKIDWMENADGGLITGSGMGAISALFLGLLKQGDHILAGDQLYGRSLRMLSQDMPRLGFEASFADPTDAVAFEAAIQDNTAIIMVEAVSNPTLRVADMIAIQKMAAARGILMVVDNTFTTPALYKPFDHGADIVIHSVTKFLSGHSDVTLGYIAARDPDHRVAIRDASVTWGMTPSPFDCWLAERGLHSFDLRFEKAQGNAARIADGLAGQSGIRQVLYPGRADHPDYALAQTLFGANAGNMVSFEIDGGRDVVDRFIENVPDIPFAPTLGDIGTTLSHPASSSHRALTAEKRASLGMNEGFFRLSVGVEDADMLIDELTHAIAVATD